MNSSKPLSLVSSSSNQSKWLRLLCTLGIAMTLSACVSKPVDVQASARSGVDFSSYKSFYMLPAPPGRPGQVINTTFHRRAAIAAVRDELLSRGYTQTQEREQADVWLAVQFSIRNESRLRNVVEYDYEPRRYGYGYGYGYGYRSYYGYSLSSHRRVEIEEFRQGNMIIDMVDRRNQTLIWEGYAQAKGEQQLNRAEKKIRKAVAGIFEQYPG